MSLQFFINHIQSEKRQSAHTVKAYRTDLLYFSEFLEKTYQATLPEATLMMIKSWIAELKGNHLDNSSINRKISAIKTFYAFLTANEMIESNPAESLRTLKVKKRVAVFVPKSDLEKPSSEIDENNFQMIRNLVIFEIFYQTGMRASEMIGLKDQDIDFIGQTIKVTGKGNKQRIIPFTSELGLQMKAYLQKREIQHPSSKSFIVSNKGGKPYESMLYRIIHQKLNEITTISKKSPHILRHTFATHMLNNGASLIAIKELLGHSSLAATQVYTHNSIEQLKTIHQTAHPKGGAK